MHIILLYTALLLALVACDSGNIPEPEHHFEQEGLTVRLNGQLSGLNSWGEKHELVLAAFDGESDYSLVQKDLPSSHEDGAPIDFTLSGIPLQAATIELCVVGRLRDRVATLAEVKVTEAMRAQPEQPILMEVGTRRLDLFGVVEGSIFKQRCEGCHKGNKPPRGLSLEGGKAHAMTVGVPSNVNAEELRVKPGRANESWLIKILEAPQEGLKFDHSKFFASRNDGRSLEGELELLKHWINEGAKP